MRSLDSSRINDVLHTIHRELSGDLTGRRLASIAAYSEPHLHRIFTRVMGESLHSYIRRVRLEQAANMLMFEPERPVLHIAEQCGYQSLSSFTRVFRERFGIAPGRWRKQHQGNAAELAFLDDEEIAAGYARVSPQELPDVELTELQPCHVAYIRHQGYSRKIRQSWQLLQAWCHSEGRDFNRQIGLHHSNPVWTSLADCRYVACIGIDHPLQRRGVVNSMTIPGGLHALFRFSGVYGELLPWIAKVQAEWLPESGLKMRPLPASVEYMCNHFLDPSGQFDVVFKLPVSFY